MTKNYLYVKQGTISRWQYSLAEDTKEYGLFTDAFFNCIIIILREKNKQKLVMIHADPSITLDDLKKEISWVGADCEKYIFYKEHPEAEETIEDLFSNDKLKNQFSLKIVKAKRNSGKIVPDLDLPLLPDGNPVPEFEATNIYSDITENSSSYSDLKDKKHIRDLYEVQQIYNKIQKPEWQTYSNHAGSYKNILLKELFNFSSHTLPEFLINNESKENLREILKKVTPGRDWKVPSVNKAWLRLSNEEEAKKIDSHLKNNNYNNAIKVAQEKGSNNFVIVLENVDFNKLKNIPPLQGSTQKEEIKPKIASRFQ